MFSHAFTQAAQAPAEQPAFFLAPGVYLADVGRKTIFLDLNQDKYQAVDRTTFRDVAARDGTMANARQQKLLQSLCDRGLMTTDAAVGRAAIPITHQQARAHLLPDRKAESTFRRITLLVDLFRTAIRSDRTLRGMPLQTCIERLRAAKAVCTQTDSIPSWLPYVLHARFYYPADLICLRDSFLLMNLLLGQGIAADLVFGVQGEPFKAHCWVQIGDVVVNDDIERTSRFSPILVV